MIFSCSIASYRAVDDGTLYVSTKHANLGIVRGLAFEFAPKVRVNGVAIGVAMAYQSPQTAVIATLEYCYMIFAILWGFVFFGDVPDLWTVLGMMLIAIGGCAALLVRPGRALEAKA